MTVQNAAIKYREYRQSQSSRRSIHAQDAYHHNNMDRYLKNKSVHDRLGKRVVDQDWADHEEEALKGDICGRKASGAQEV